MRSATKREMATKWCTPAAVRRSQRRRAAPPPRARPPPRGAGPPRHRRHEQPGREPGPRAEVLVVEVPDVAHRRETVADVERPPRHARAPGDRMARGEEQVVAAEIQPAYRGRGERQGVG